MEKKCKTCAYHDNYTWACSNAYSDQVADFTDNDFVCEVWDDGKGTDKTATKDRK